MPIARRHRHARADGIRKSDAPALRGECDAERAAANRDARKRHYVKPASEADAKPDAKPNAARSNRSDRRAAERDADSESHRIADRGAEQAASRDCGIAGSGGARGRRPRRVARPLVSRCARAAAIKLERRPISRTELPTETFMNSNSHIESIRSANVGAQQFQVTADVQTTSGEYYVTFTVEQGPTGLLITDHYAIKPQ